jgi:hypothetical protein
MSDDDEDASIMEQAETLKRLMAETLSANPQAFDRLSRAIHKALKGLPRVLALTAMADVLSHDLVAVDPVERKVVLAAFATMTLEMTAIRDTMGQTRQ